ncbi:PspC domain-containing protein [uncultured Sphaerochaeta sp.]|uniref:PspC domain-containing protein n=1 Tax=uncultured Sphaerochaeta sp. TaxID=886478 RepID=UPI002A0A6106|nr:PspC domain-containing protein [uncultured Sphaerochaeta sp.]
MTGYRRDSNKLYREHNGIFLGVFQGLANWSGLPVWALRIIGIIVFFSIGFWKIGVLYLLAAILMPSRY